MRRYRGDSLGGLDCGRTRVAERQGVGQCTFNQWAKKPVLLSFRLIECQRPRVIDRRLGRCTGFECCHRRCGNLQFCTGWGLRPVRAVRSCTSNVPKPGNVSDSPFCNVSEIISTRAFQARSAAAALESVFTAIASKSSFLFLACSCF